MARFVLDFLLTQAFCTLIVSILRIVPSQTTSGRIAARIWQASPIGSYWYDSSYGHLGRKRHLTVAQKRLMGQVRRSTGTKPTRTISIEGDGYL